MSVKHGLLALLQRGPMYGYQLRVAFDSATGGTWPLNIGQVYTTLSRLERDDLVTALPENEGQRPYEITSDGRTELKKWFATPVQRGDRPRDEVAIKLALAITTPGVDVRQGRDDPAHGHDAHVAGVHEAQDPARRPAVAARAGRDDLPGRGRTALARPLRGEPRPLRTKAVPAATDVEVPR